MRNWLFAAVLAAVSALEAYHTSVPVEFSESNIPYVELIIEGKKCFLDVDTGFAFPLTIRRPYLDELQNKKLSGSRGWFDIKGNHYRNPEYILPEFNIGSLVVSDCYVLEMDDNFYLNTHFGEGMYQIPSSNCGSLGWPLLEKVNVLFDFYHYNFLISNESEKLKEEGYSLEEMTMVPFEIDEGIVFQIETDLGKHRVMLDTGCTVNFFNSALLRERTCERTELGMPVCSSLKFVMNGVDFGKTDIFFYDIHHEFQVDGLLGMDFLDRHVIYFDFPSQVAYIAKTKL